MRLEVWRALMASASYMGEKNLGFTCHHYRTIRGELDEWQYAHSLGGSKIGCCSDSGCEQKIHFAFKKARGGENATTAIEISLVLALQATKERHTTKGGADNQHIEGLFSICRMMGLKHDLGQRL